MWSFVAVSIEYMHRAESAKWLPSTKGPGRLEYARIWPIKKGQICCRMTVQMRENKGEAAEDLGRNEHVFNWGTDRNTYLLLVCMLTATSKVDCNASATAANSTSCRDEKEVLITVRWPSQITEAWPPFRILNKGLRSPVVRWRCAESQLILPRSFETYLKSVKNPIVRWLFVEVFFMGTIGSLDIDKDIEVAFFRGYNKTKGR